MLIPPLKELKSEIDKQYFINSFKRNNDGIGMAYVINIGKDDSEVKLQKGFVSLKKFLTIYANTRKENPKSYFMVHFRYATFGDKSIKNCHPFWVKNKKMVMAHNGTIIKMNAQRNIGVSDTSLFVDLIKKLPPDWLTRDIYTNLIHKYIGENNKIAFLTKDNEIIWFNSEKWIEQDKILFSNEYFKPQTTETKEETKNDEDKKCYVCKQKSFIRYYGVYYCNECYQKIINPSTNNEKNIIPFNSIQRCSNCDLELIYESEKKNKLCIHCAKESFKNNCDNIYEV
jgi:predicted glutamine amidotransferase